MKIYIAIFFIFISFLGCKKESDSANNYAYFGGEIINPNTNYVVLSKNEVVIDTIKLDGRNRFLYKVEDLEQGLYAFRHGGEYQMVLLEPKDSVLFRLNTLDFDESLVFTGDGDKKNNYLINEYLENEKQEKYIVRLCQLTPEAYSTHVDSLKANKVKVLEHFKNKYKPSGLFLKIAQANINYNYYSSKEVYPFVHYGTNKAANLKSLPEDFYSYRKDINYNDAFLSTDYNYTAFLRHNFSNMSLKIHDEHSENTRFNRKALCYNLDRLNLIDSLVENQTTKDDLLYHFAMRFLSKSKDEADNNAILKSYLAKSKSENNIDMMVRYTKSINGLKEGLRLPQINMINSNNDVVDINSLINKPTAITFWSQAYYDHFKKSHKKLNELKTKYPEVRFISINIDKCGIEKSKKILASHQFDQTHEYQFKNPQEGKEILAVHPMTKTIILDKNSKIVNSRSNIFSSNFEDQLLGLINK
ncbi:TlpA family protein disulfide reductase [Flavisericum labens]|uniref:TlpA family protein disulfide reductase n=1 Tax=Flavisericum labens TaxID=3377112 RepID=UPI00387AD627